MEISPADVSIIVRARKAIAWLQWQLALTSLVGVALVLVSIFAPLAPNTANILLGAGFGVIGGTPLHFLSRFKDLLGLAERAANSSRRGIELLASRPPQHVA